MIENKLLKLRKPRIAVFIDAGNLWSSYKLIGKVIDFNNLASFLINKFDGRLFKVFYYVAFPKIGTRSNEEVDGLHKFLTFLKKGLAYEIEKKPLKRIHLRNQKGDLIYDQITGEPHIVEKGNMDVEIAIDAVRYASTYDIAVFFTGDSDFLSLISFLRNLKKPKKVYIFSSEGCISHELKTGGDGYFDLKDFPEIHRGNLKNKKIVKK